MLLDVRAFLATARAGSFSGAARSIGVAPSVITKRVGRLETRVGTPLFIRSTRKLSLTAEGERLRPRLQELVGEIDLTLDGAQTAGITGQLRIKAPTTIGTLYVGPALVAFQSEHPGIAIEFVLMDRGVNPLEEGLDIALGALPQSYASVEETPLCAYRRMLVGAPAYLERNPAPVVPGDIAQHDCLAFVPIGLSWVFQSDRAQISVDVHARMTVNDSRVLIAATEAGLGLSIVPQHLVAESLEAGRLVPVMQDFPIPPLWFKAMVPRTKASRPAVAALVKHLVEWFADFPQQPTPTART
ncbi:LysR family transcriptional regulator [Mesobaculum littorinae]|uniref:LysR family transcriptional regulator n=1 Tax=Mesobaculum littorinae TaxID=2486419 RepID=A0A438ALH6_9RHOB|nr:LysR family transcriptional regulator [Mesobaculum littorinae]RVV99598.1 LysR family transcriptional regulator [Mesobaculum littorinae]